MVALDTNVLVYAHRSDVPFHAAALRCLDELGEGAAPWGIPWPCIHEFLNVVTRARAFPEPTAMGDAIAEVETWMEAPTLVLLGESLNHWKTLREQLVEPGITGPRVHDARIAAICIEHGVRELWSADRDLSRFPGLKVVNPLVTRS